MSLNLEDLSELTVEQKQGMMLILKEIESSEPFGPGTSYDWAKELTEKLNLVAPSETVLNRSEMYRRLTQLSGEITFKVHDITDPNGNPVLTITGSTPSLDKLFMI